MKKILMILTMALAATSCMDILDVAPEDQIASENMWTTEELADKGMAGLYFPFYATQLSSTQLRRADGLMQPPHMYKLQPMPDYALIHLIVSFFLLYRGGLNFFELSYFSFLALFNYKFYFRNISVIYKKIIFNIINFVKLFLHFCNICTAHGYC